MRIASSVSVPQDNDGASFAVFQAMEYEPSGDFNRYNRKLKVKTSKGFVHVAIDPQNIDRLISWLTAVKSFFDPINLPQAIKLPQAGTTSPGIPSPEPFNGTSDDATDDEPAEMTIEEAMKALKEMGFGAAPAVIPPAVEKK